MRIAIVGLGKIARDQHLPAIAATPGFELAAVASPHHRLDDVPSYRTLEDLLAAEPAVDAVAVCTPTQVRRSQAALALEAGKHVLLEKPPGASAAEIAPLQALAHATGRTLFASWHSRFAPAVEPARAFIAEHGARYATITWKEDARVWHPGQDWIWEPGGLGVFDPGINALSILTRILPRPVFVTAAELAFPANRAAPIAASVSLADGAGLVIEAEFDFRQTGRERWDIDVQTGAGLLALSGGGTRLVGTGRPLIDATAAEYLGLYRRFAELIGEGASDVDLAPLVHVADAFMLGRRVTVAPFEH